MTSILTRLPHRFISVMGEDAEKFLQGQMSCDLSLLDLNKASFGTLNTPKGRMYALFKIVRIDNGFLFCLQKDTLEHVLTILGKYIAFFKCHAKEHAQFKAYGLLEHKNSDAPTLPSSLPKSHLHLSRNEDKITIKLLCKDLYEIWSRDTLDALEGQLAQEKWFSQEVLNGIPELYPNTQEKFILQYLNLQEIGAVSFKKGCYTGQEIIARMKFLGKLKKKMFLLQYDGPSLSDIYDSNSDIYDAEGKKCGILIRAHYSKVTGAVALGILSVNFADGSSLVFLDSDLKHGFSVKEIHY